MLIMNESVTDFIRKGRRELDALSEYLAFLDRIFHDKGISADLQKTIDSGFRIISGMSMPEWIRTVVCWANDLEKTLASSDEQSFETYLTANGDNILSALDMLLEFLDKAPDEAVKIDETIEKESREIFTLRGRTIVQNIVAWVNDAGSILHKARVDP